MIFLFDSLRGWGYNDHIMTFKVQLAPSRATPSSRAKRCPAPSYATRMGSGGLSRPAREGAAAGGAIRHLVVSGENLLADPRFCVGQWETEAASS